jgi:hypothetical protein
MNMATRSLCAAAALLALSACGDPGENAAGGEGNAAAAPAEAEKGRLSVKGGGLEFAIQIPEGVQEKARVGGDNDIMPPGASIEGLHIQGDGGDAEAGQDSVAMRFHSDQPPAEVTAWYRDPARAPDLREVEARREGADTIVSGRTGEGGNGRFTVRLTGGTGGGTDGQITLIDGN